MDKNIRLTCLDCGNDNSSEGLGFVFDCDVESTGKYFYGKIYKDSFMCYNCEGNNIINKDDPSWKVSDMQSINEFCSGD